MGFFDRFLDAVRLNDDDFDDDDEFYDDEEELDDLDDEPEPPKRRFFSKLGSTKKNEDFDDEEEDEEPEPTPVRSSDSRTAASSRPAVKLATKPTPQPAPSSKVTPIRKGRAAGGGSMEVCVIKPTKVEDFREIADTLLSYCTVVLNLEGIDVELAQRIIDFSSGSCYAIGGGLQKVSSYIFILTPSNVEISGDIQDLLGGAIPSMRSSY